MCGTVVVVLCAFAVMPILALNFTYETKYLDVPVSNAEPGREKCMFLLIRRLFNPFSTVFTLQKCPHCGLGDWGSIAGAHPAWYPAGTRVLSSWCSVTHQKHFLFNIISILTYYLNCYVMSSCVSFGDLLKYQIQSPRSRDLKRDISCIAWGWLNNPTWLCLYPAMRKSIHTKIEFKAYVMR